MGAKIKDVGKRFLESMMEFFNPRDWIPSIPLPPIGRWKKKGDGAMPLWAAIRGFPPEDEWHE